MAGDHQLNQTLLLGYRLATELSQSQASALGKVFP